MNLSIILSEIKKKQSMFCPCYSPSVKMENFTKTLGFFCPTISSPCPLWTLALKRLIMLIVLLTMLVKMFEKFGKICASQRLAIFL